MKQRKAETANQDIYEDFKLTRNLWPPWFIQKYFSPLRLKTTKYFYTNHEDHECLSQLFPLHLNTYVMGLRPLLLFLLLQCGD